MHQLGVSAQLILNNPGNCKLENIGITYHCSTSPLHWHFI